ncbi:glycosyltransferase [Methanocella conradii]|uniref:glycosyltransferase n=1 Tax=Methanocella conradii TaxID=1175444 RepID=UPI0024B34961|nr:glycosyltransferase [Methanocella conradii]MDI6897768.1 glycosyltransferase [Methanocella conradii]
MGYGPSIGKGVVSGMAGAASIEKPQMAPGGENKLFKVSVIIPTMNEPAIGRVVDDARKALKHFDAEVIVVDKSTDDTARRAKKAGAIVVGQELSGYGDAYMTGFSLIAPDTDVVVMMDGDNTYDAYEIPMLIDPIIKGYADLCLGNRFARMEPGAMNARNRLGNKVITSTLNVLYGLRLKDSQTGFRAIKKTALDTLELVDNGMPFASEMIIDARKKSLRIVEVPVTYRQRIGEAKLKAYKDGPLILSLIIRMVRDYNPFAIFISVGGIMVLCSFVSGGFVVYEWLTTGVITRLALTMLTAMLFLSGVQVISFGLLADIILAALRKKR